MVAKVIFGVAASALTVAGLFALAGRWDWTGGWVYVGLLVGGHAASMLVTWRVSPELIRRRAHVGRGTKRWDVFVMAALGLSYVATLVVGALDGGRGGSGGSVGGVGGAGGAGGSAMPGWLCWAGAGLFALYLVNLTWVMTSNPFFEKTARIQADRGQRVIDTGPYAFIRHPGYLGGILGFVAGTPLMLGSWWSFVPAGAAALCLVLRTALEDAMLRRELPGYAEYATRVRSRLVPWIW